MCVLFIAYACVGVSSSSSGYQTPRSVLAPLPPTPSPLSSYQIPSNILKTSSPPITQPLPSSTIYQTPTNNRRALQPSYENTDCPTRPRIDCYINVDDGPVDELEDYRSGTRPPSQVSSPDRPPQMGRYENTTSVCHCEQQRCESVVLYEEI